jgi:hypothetical protein
VESLVDLGFVISDFGLFKRMVFHYEKLDALMKENDEILAIVVASIRTAKKHIA